MTILSMAHYSSFDVYMYVNTALYTGVIEDGDGVAVGAAEDDVVGDAVGSNCLSLHSPTFSQDSFHASPTSGS